MLIRPMVAIILLVDSPGFLLSLVGSHGIPWSIWDKGRRQPSVTMDK